MKKNVIILLILIFALSNISKSQETIKLMQYNLLYYGRTTDFCTSSNNNIDNKNAWLSTIIQHEQPDIFCVNEMDDSNSDIDYLMDNALNTGGITYYDRASLSGDYLVNMIYYNSEKLTLQSQTSISAPYRQIDVYNMSYNSSETRDVYYFTCFVAHLKSGQGSAEQAARAEATANLMSYIEATGIGNYLFMGDFNLYTPTEDAFQNIINPANSDFKFYDPVNQIGEWSQNPNYSDYHTQSTHSSGSCHSGGGMDDRFDFIMISESVKTGTDDVQYVQGSYETVGQDGNHFDQSINEGSNNSEPAEVIDALYHMSDHLPVCLQLEFNSGSVATTVFDKDFDDSSLSSGGWSQYSVIDDAHYWEADSYYNDYFGKMSGYDDGAIENEDWLISPSFNANFLQNEILSFDNASGYYSQDLELFYSDNYLGSGNPNNAVWNQITGFNLSTDDDWEWQSSGNIDLSDITGESIHLGFKYISSDSYADTWELDNILLTANISSNVNKIKSNNINAFCYPIPFSDKLEINYNASSNTNTLIEIYNITGRLIKSINNYNESEGKNSYTWSSKNNLNKIMQGIYIIKITNGFDVQTIKTVKVK